MPVNETTSINIGLGYVLVQKLPVNFVKNFFEYFEKFSLLEFSLHPTRE